MTDTPDLRTLAAEAVTEIMGWEDDRDDPGTYDVPPAASWTVANDVACAVLAAVLPVAADVLAAYAGNYPEAVFPADSDSRDAISGTAMRHAYGNAARIVRELAAATPPAGPESTLPAETAPAVGREAPERQGRSEGAGWVPLAEVLDALRDKGAVERFAERHGNDEDGWYVEHIDRDRMCLYLAERFPTAPQGAEAESPTFSERRAAKDPSVDHSSHSASWVGGCGECPGETAPQGADERTGSGER